MESLWKPVIKRLDQRLCDFKLPRKLSGKNFFPSLLFFVGLFVGLFFCLWLLFFLFFVLFFFVFFCFFVLFCFFLFCFFCFVFFLGGGVGGWFIKISYLCYLSWLARAFSNSRKYIAKYSYSSSNAIYFFSSE